MSKIAQNNFCEGNTFSVIRKSYLTLLEILIVVAIISLVGGLAAIGIRSAIREQRFRSEVSQVLSTLRLAQQIMLILKTDVHVKFRSEPNSRFIYRIELDDQIGQRWQTLLTKSKVLQEIHSINFTGASGQGQKELDLKFLSGGSVMSQGILRLGVAPPNTPDTPEAFICLPGFPRFLQSTTDPLTEADCQKEKQRNYSQAVARVTRDDLLERQKAHLPEPEITGQPKGTNEEEE